MKVIVVNKTDFYKFDKFTDRLFKADCHEVKIIEDFTDLDANTVSEDIVENESTQMILRFRRSAEDDCGMAFPTNTTPWKTSTLCTVADERKEDDHYEY